MKVPLTDDQATKMLRTIDKDNSGTIELHEFTDAFKLRAAVLKMKAEKEKEAYELPSWINRLYSSEVCRDALYKLYTALGKKGYSTNEVFSLFDRDGSKNITRTEFRQALSDSLGPLINSDEMEILVMLADLNNSGTINYSEFSILMSNRVIDEIESDGKLDSTRVNKSTMEYVIQKCLE